MDIQPLDSYQNILFLHFRAIDFIINRIKTIIIKKLL